MSGLGNVANRNKLVILGFEFLWGLSSPFVLFSTIHPGYLEHLGASKTVIGLIPALYWGALALVQPLSAYLIPTDGTRLRKVAGVYLAGACCYLPMATAAIFLTQGPMSIRLMVYFFCLTSFVVLVGFGDPHYLSMAVEASTPQDRGRFFGLRIMCLGLGGLVGAPGPKFLLRHFPAPESYGLCFLFGGLILIAASSWFSLIKDCPDQSAPPRQGLRHYLRENAGALVRNRVFVEFLLSFSLFCAAQASFTFLALYLKRKLGYSGDEFLANLNFAYIACLLTMSLLFGVLADRFGPALAYGAAIVCVAVGFLTALCGPASFFCALAAYFLASCWVPGSWATGYNLAVRAAPQVKPVVVAATISLTISPVRIFAPLIAGSVIDRLSYTPVFWGSIGLAALSLVPLGLLVSRRGRS